MQINEINRLFSLENCLNYITVFQLDQNRGALHSAPKILCPSALFSHPLCPSALSTLLLHPSALFMPYMNPKRVRLWCPLVTLSVAKLVQLISN